MLLFQLWLCKDIFERINDAIKIELTHVGLHVADSIAMAQKDKYTDNWRRDRLRSLLNVGADVNDKYLVSLSKEAIGAKSVGMRLKMQLIEVVAGFTDKFLMNVKLHTTENFERFVFNFIPIEFARILGEYQSEAKQYKLDQSALFFFSDRMYFNSLNDFMKIRLTEYKITRSIVETIYVKGIKTVTNSDDMKYSLDKDIGKAMLKVFTTPVQTSSFFYKMSAILDPRIKAAEQLGTFMKGKSFKLKRGKITAIPSKIDDVFIKGAQLLKSLRKSEEKKQLQTLLLNVADAHTRFGPFSLNSFGQGIPYEKEWVEGQLQSILELVDVRVDNPTLSSLEDKFYQVYSFEVNRQNPQFLAEGTTFVFNSDNFNRMVTEYSSLQLKLYFADKIKDTDAFKNYASAHQAKNQMGLLLVLAHYLKDNKDLKSITSLFYECQATFTRAFKQVQQSNPIEHSNLINAIAAGINVQPHMLFFGYLNANNAMLSQ